MSAFVVWCALVLLAEAGVWRYQRAVRSWDAAERRDRPAERAYFSRMR